MEESFLFITDNVCNAKELSDYVQVPGISYQGVMHSVPDNFMFNFSVSVCEGARLADCLSVRTQGWLTVCL